MLQRNTEKGSIRMGYKSKGSGKGKQVVGMGFVEEGKY
jgi:hypothetical protein